MSYNFNIGELKENARYTVSTIDNWDGSSKTEEMTGAMLKSFTNRCAHLYDIYAEEITEEETAEKFKKEIENKTSRKEKNMEKNIHAQRHRVHSMRMHSNRKRPRRIREKKSAVRLQYFRIRRKERIRTFRI